MPLFAKTKEDWARGKERLGDAEGGYHLLCVSVFVRMCVCVGGVCQRDRENKRKHLHWHWL